MKNQGLGHPNMLSFYTSSGRRLRKKAMLALQKQL